MAKDAKNPTIGISQASELTGLSQHMITYLGRVDILSPSGTILPRRGRRRLYTFNDVLFLRVIADLLSKGIEVKRLKDALQKARADAETWIDIRQAPRRFLVTDGTELFVHRKGRLESKTVDRQLAFAFVLDLAHTHQSIAEAWPTEAKKAR